MAGGLARARHSGRLEEALDEDYVVRLYQIYIYIYIYIYKCVCYVDEDCVIILDQGCSIVLNLYYDSLSYLKIA